MLRSIFCTVSCAVRYETLLNVAEVIHSGGRPKGRVPQPSHRTYKGEIEDPIVERKTDSEKLSPTTPEGNDRMT
ncbi:unnamed protein product [Allacma fusca]|uniref:Uncharacterized protein n=1 Tax=Allacma fusca TaxID=39272 RepID=A0A8J2LUS1_9HEXA|nr:unnamed protein product [Allacma fusca]